MKLKVLLIFGFALTFACSQTYTTPAPQTSAPRIPEQIVTATSAETEILTEGVAGISAEGALDIARDHAIDDALRKAVEQGVGVYIDSETQISNFQLISDNIYSQTSGYVSSYRIIDEGASGGIYNVVIKAIVKTENIENDLAAIGILLGEQGRPRVMVVVKELGSLSELSDSGTLMSSIMFETIILDNFRELGFPVVDAATVSEIIERDQLKLILEGDDATATLLGLEAGAEIIITGTALHSEENRIIAGSSREIHEFEVSTRAINTSTGNVLAGSAVTIAVPFSKSQARTEAADNTSNELSSAILSGWVQQENTTVIVISNADFTTVQILRSEIRTKLRGVLDVITRDFTGSKATLEVISDTATSQVIDELTSGELLETTFEVTGLSANRVEIRLTD